MGGFPSRLARVFQDNGGSWFRFWGFMKSSDSIIFLCVLFCRLLLRNHILSNLCLVLSWNLLPQKVLTDLIELCYIGEIVVMWSGYFGSSIYIFMLFCDVSLYYDVLLFTFFSSGIGGYWMAQYKYTVCLCCIWS